MRRQNTDTCSVIARHANTKNVRGIVMSLCFCIASSTLFLSVATANAQQNERPNFLVIVADDMGLDEKRAPGKQTEIGG